MKGLILFFSLLVPLLGVAQNYSIDWYKIAGGGGSSIGGVYSISGTIGQPDAGGPMTGGNHSLTGGFWALSAVQVPGAPQLYITRTGPSTALVWWLAASGSYTLQTNSNVTASGAWTAFGGTINSSGGTNSVTMTPSVGNLFFRLKQ